MENGKEFEDILKIEGVNSLGYGIIPKAIMKDLRLTIEAKAIYSYFVSYAGAGNTAFPGLKMILNDLSISENRFYKHRKQLIEFGYISVEAIRNEKKQIIKNIYTLHSNPEILLDEGPLQNEGQGIPQNEGQGIPQNEGGNINSIKNNILKEEEDIYTRASTEFNQLISDNEELADFAKYFLACQLDIPVVLFLLKELVLYTELQNKTLIVQQMQWCKLKAEKEGIFDFTQYFINGLKQRIENNKVEILPEAEKEFNNHIRKDLPDIPLFNWLEN